MRLISKLEGGGDHPSSGVAIPRAGESFEVDDARGAQIVAAGLASEEKGARRPTPKSEKE